MMRKLKEQGIALIFGRNGRDLPRCDDVSVLRDGNGYDQAHRVTTNMNEGS